MKITINIETIKLFIPLLAGMLSAVIAGFSLTSLDSSKPKIVDSYPDFEKAVTYLLKGGEQFEIKDVSLILEAIQPPSDVNQHKLILRNYLLKLNYKILSDTSNLIVQDSEKILWSSKVQDVISKLDENSPYQNLDPLEASIFQDIAALTDNVEIERKLKQLSGLVQVRFEELEQSKLEARWSLIFGIAGVVVGLVSIMLGIFPLFRSEAKGEHA
ncbi:hypothetical protein L4C39_19150 [Vibrio clamense]|uniref:hypothetical protein n=1 Tax=Vibrio clamense TaxID=2910254 RepID=UPI000DEB8423|nr:hypothetical protein DS893_00290 [Vibrionales bacterium C3R12]